MRDAPRQQFKDSQVDEQKRSLITTSVDFDRDGLQTGVLKIPYSSDRSAYGYIPVPIWVAKGGEGPTVLLTGGNHGDEYEGPIALMRLFHEGAFEAVNGRIIVIPALNMPAYRAGRRTSPIDHVNLNRAFPGKRDGTVTEMLAHYVETELLGMADIVIDIHSGGSSLTYLPTLITYAPRTDTHREKLERAVAAFAPPRWMQMDLLVEDRVIGAGAERNDAIFLTGEFGGGAMADPAGIAIVTTGISAVLSAFGLIMRDESRQAHAPELLRVIPGEHYIYAPRQGIFEPLFKLGDTVQKGEPAGRLYDSDEPWRAPLEIHWAGSGLVACVRTFALCEAGDCLAHLASVSQNS